MELVLGIDMGTSYFKLGLFDRSGEMHGLGRVRVTADTEATGRCELPIDRFWSLLREALSHTCQQADSSPTDIKAVSYSSQANTFVLMDKDNCPLTPLIIWTDERVKQIDPAVHDLWSRDDFLSITGLGMAPSPQACVTKLKWFQQHRPEIWSRTRRVMTISDYLTFALIGCRVGDMGTASLLGILDMQQSRWWQSALDHLSLDEAFLSIALPPAAVAGYLTNSSQQYLPLPPRIPLSVGSLDHHVASVGAGVGVMADASESTGTVLACLNYSKAFSPRADCCMGPQADGAGYYQLAFSQFGAGILQWYQQTQAPDIDLDDLAAMAERAPIGCDGLVAIPEYTPPQARCTFKNVLPDHQTGHFVRAIMEAIAKELHVLFKRLCPVCLPQRIVATGGGARSDIWLQIKADLLHTQFIVSNCTEPACRGAAMFAAVAADWFKDLDQCAHLWCAAERVFLPHQK